MHLNPEPKLLALHPDCAQVLHLSGAAQYAEKVLRDMEKTEVLESAGSSADLLHNIALPAFLSAAPDIYWSLG
ncbi:hypothetical protein OBBRIDRAFT_746101 [Obba rivulosa]|uniref:Uncharacterized protein n=1 Tax=Obba rivulosa TaxID=1052685 RepID=A0A8E2DT15_9APHY|nr:hypothetical protein OBBRIDRAFT_746101 [Obba rivulosa]